MTKSLPCSITLLAQENYDLPFAPKEKPLLFNKGSRSLNLLQPFHIYAKTLKHFQLSISSGSYCVKKQDKKTCPHFQEIDYLIICQDLCLFPDLHKSGMFQLTSSGYSFDYSYLL